MVGNEEIRDTSNESQEEQGVKDWEALKKQAADNAGITAPPESFQMKFIPGFIKEGIEDKFVDEVYKLLIMRPEFYIGEFK